MHKTHKKGKFFENFCILKFFSSIFVLSFSSTDENLSSSYNNLLTAPSSYHQPLQTSSIGSIQNQGLISSSLSLPHGINSNSIYQQGPGSSGMAQSLSTQPLEHYNDEFYPSTAGIDEQYIYVTYPSAELKKRLNDRYARETLLVLTNDEPFLN